MPRAAASPRVHPHRLAAGDLGGLAVRADVELAVQPGGAAGWRSGAAGTGPPAGRRATPPAPARPGGPGSRRSRSRRWSAENSSIRPLGVAERVRAPGRPGTRPNSDLIGVGPGGSDVLAGRPELVEVRHLVPAVGQPVRATPRTGAEPRRRASRPSVKAAAGAQAAGQRGEDRRSRRGPRRAGGSARCMAIRWRVAAAGADVVALERRGDRQHDVGVPGGRGPVRLVHDTIVSGRPKARRSRPRSWWWWNGLPPAQ